MSRQIYIAAINSNRAEFDQLAKTCKPGILTNALGYAAKYGQFGMVQYIVLQGVKSNAKVMRWAAKSNNSEILDFLASHFGWNNVNKLLQVAAKHGNLDVVKCILAKDESPSKGWGMQSHEATKWQSRATKKELASQIKERNEHAKSIMLGAVMGCRYEIIDFAKSLGATLNAGHLLCAARYGNCEMIEYILHEKKSGHGITKRRLAECAGEAAFYKHFNAVKLFVEHNTMDMNDFILIACLARTREIEEYVLTQINGTQELVNVTVELIERGHPLKSSGGAGNHDIVKFVVALNPATRNGILSYARKEGLQNIVGMLK